MVLKSAASEAAAALTIKVVSKVIVDTVAGRTRLGGGGAQAAVGIKLAVPEASCSLVAPVGTDFSRALLRPLAEDYGVDVPAPSEPHQ